MSEAKCVLVVWIIEVKKLFLLQLIYCVTLLSNYGGWSFVVSMQTILNEKQMLFLANCEWMTFIHYEQIKLKQPFH